MELFFLTLRGDTLSLCHEALDHVLEISYCRQGRLGWEMEDGNHVYLGQGDYAVQTMKTCANSLLTLPNGYYEGLILCVDLDILTASPPYPLAESGITGDLLYEKFCRENGFVSLAGNSKTDAVFSSFYDLSKGTGNRLLEAESPGASPSAFPDTVLLKGTAFPVPVPARLN